MVGTMILFLSCFVLFLRQFHCTAQAGLELSEPPTPASLVQKLRACAITPNLDFTLHFLILLEVRRQGLLVGPFKALDTGQQGVHYTVTLAGHGLLHVAASICG